VFVERFVTGQDPSVNNQRWHRHPGNPILRPTPGSWTEDWIANETVIRIGDRYFMYLDGKRGPVEKVGVATVEMEKFDGITWEEYAGNPILDVGPKGYDHVSVLDPSVLHYKGQVWMYYTGIGGPPDHICLAISEDGYHFTKYDKNPILVGRCPHAIVREDVLYLFYLAFNEVGGYDVRLATSKNGIDFVQHERRPILARGAEGDWDSFSIVTTRIFYEDGIYNMLYAGDWERVDEPRGFGLATSGDLVNWEKFEDNPIFLPGQPDEWDSEAIWCPWVHKHGDKYLMWYCGSSTTYVEGLTPQVGLATI